MHLPPLTPGARRAVQYAARWSGQGQDIGVPHLLLGLLAEPECRAAQMLAEYEVDRQAVLRQWPAQEAEAAQTDPPLAPDAHHVLATAEDRLHEFMPGEPLATEHLLWGITVAGNSVAAWLSQQGLAADRLEQEIHRLCGHDPNPIALEEPPAQAPPPLAVADMSSADPSPPETDASAAVLRTLDAAANRAREGLRVVEDYVRFVLDDRHLTECVKRLRHELAAALAPLATAARSRDTQHDVGTGLTAETERRRATPPDVLAANLRRVQESLRSLEEFGKLVDADVAAAIKQLRYRSYTLQQAVERTGQSIERLDRVRLYVLVPGGEDENEFRRLVASLVSAGVDAIQLRDKRLDDRTLTARARALCDQTRGTQTLALVNDRPDIAAVARANGVHVGQEEMSVSDARRIVGPDALVGVSTHSLEQARQAVLDGADYIGVGPVFPSATKQFDAYVGLELLAKVAAEIRLPAFAIGGVDLARLDDVLATGIGRIAVASAVTASSDPHAAVCDLHRRLHSQQKR